MMHTNHIQAFPSRRRLQTVAVVSNDPHEHVFETVLGAIDHDVVFIESTAHAYTHIKQVSPDLVIVCLSDDDRNVCQVLSMLKFDRETSRIPVVTYATDSYGTVRDEEED